MSTVLFVNVSALGAALALSLLLVLAAAMGGSLNRPINRWFFVMLLINLWQVIAELALGLGLGHPGARLHAVLQMLEFTSVACTGLLIIAFSFYFHALRASKGDSDPAPLRIGIAIGAAATAITVVGQFTNMFSIIDGQNAYHMQPLYWVSAVCPILISLLICAVTVRDARLFSTAEKVVILLYALMPIICNLLEVAIPELWIFEMVSSVVLFLIYISIQMEQARQALRQEAELVESRTAIVLSQIQPHFLYNALSAVSNLCRSVPAAQRAVLTFADYLRVNMDSLTQKAPIPFARELEHTRQYLWLEQLRFEERLRVVYGIETDAFMIPPLTLQPIVENAVRYGITKAPSGGTVTIAVRRKAGAFEITVTDDGAGFDPGQQNADGRSHTGIENVRHRLSVLCGGTLSISSAPGEGTTATIEIPRRMGA